MALIKCPECGREISDRAAACPGCGFPVAEIDTRSDMDRIADELYEKYPSNKAKAVKEFQKLTGMGLRNAKDIFDAKYQHKDASSAIDTSLQREEKQRQNKEDLRRAKEDFRQSGMELRQAGENLRNSFNTLANLTTKDRTVRCPKCGSTSITYIQKRGGFFGVEVMDGIFAGGSSSKGRCKCLNCGKEWKK